VVKVRFVNQRARRVELVTIPAGHALIFRCDAVRSGYAYERRNLRLFAYVFSDALSRPRMTPASSRPTALNSGPWQPWCGAGRLPAPKKRKISESAPAPVP
jgi:hypothetical protein